MSSLEVRVRSQIVSECIQKIAFTWGYRWIDGQKVGRLEKIYLGFSFFGVEHITWHNTPIKRIDKHLDGIEDFAQILQWFEDNAKQQETPVTIGKYEGKISADGQELVVDCQTITLEEVKDIYEKMVELSQ